MSQQEEVPMDNPNAFTLREMEVIADLCKKQELTQTQLLRQALRLYQKDYLDKTRPQIPDPSIKTDFSDAPAKPSVQIAYWRVTVLGTPWKRDIHTREVVSNGKTFKRVFIVPEPEMLITEGAGDQAMRIAQTYAEHHDTRRAIYEATSASRLKGLPYEITEEDIKELKP